jgi:hypothetical protein
MIVKLLILYRLTSGIKTNRSYPPASIPGGAIILDIIVILSVTPCHSSESSHAPYNRAAPPHHAPPTSPLPKRAALLLRAMPFLPARSGIVALHGAGGAWGLAWRGVWALCEACP